MSEQEKTKTGGSTESPVVVIDSSRHSSKQLYRPADMQEEAAPETHHKRAKAPAVPSVAEEIKPNVNDDFKTCEHEISSEKHMHSVAKKLSASQSKRGSSPESLAMVAMDSKKGTITPTQPIPAPVTTKESDLVIEKGTVEKKDEDDSITDEIDETRTPNVAKRSSEWSDDDKEAGGLPRSESRASRVIVAMRQMFCCGVPLEPPSEHNISPRTYDDGI